MLEHAPRQKKNNTNLILRLWRNKESRQVIIQIITITIICIAAALILRNISINLKAIGKEFNFGFLFTPAGYDITFQPILSYSPTDTHLRAAVIGIINTLLIAFSGIILATVMGFTLGVLRLSSNWLVSRMVYCFIEFTRNVPVLLHILFVHALIVHSFPVPKKAIDIMGTSFLTNRGMFVPRPVFGSTFYIVVIAFVLGLLLIYFFSKWAKKVQNETGKIYPVFLISTSIFFGFPLIAFFWQAALFHWITLS